MKTIARSFVVGSFILLSAASSANAGVRFSLFGDADHSDFVNSGVDTSGNMAFGGGIGIEVPITGAMSFELDGIYLPRNNVASFTSIEIPLLFRVWLGNYFTIAAGTYYDQGVGSATPIGGGASTTFNGAGLTNNNLGVMGAVGFNVPVADWLSIMAEGRYGFGVYNVSYYQGTTATLNDIQVFVGVRIGSFETSYY